MRSPRAEWVLFAAHFAILDYLRARGEADQDTLSEVCRDGFRVDTPRGWWTFTAGLAASAVAFHRHICKENR